MQAFIFCFAMMMSIVVLDKVVPFIIRNVVFFGFNAVYQPLIQAMISKLSDKDDGIMVGKGTHDSLLRDCPVYQEIYYSQFRKEATENDE